MTTFFLVFLLLKNSFVAWQIPAFAFQNAPEYLLKIDKLFNS